ncbi:DMT family transporter [soil metagenome]
MDPTQRNRLAFGRRCVLAAAVLWSLSGVIAKGLDGLDAPVIAFYRGLFAGLVLLPWASRSRRSFRPGMIHLVFAFGAMTGMFIGAIKTTTAANAIFLQYSSAIWAVPASLLILRERPDRRSLLGISVAAVGILVIVSRGEKGPDDQLGISLALASGLCYALVAVGIRALRDCDPIWLSAVNNLGGSMVLGAWILGTAGSIPLPTPVEALALLAFGVVQMAIPYALFARGLQEVPAPEAGLISLIEPLLNPLWVFLFHAERPAPETIQGGALVLCGVALRYLPWRWPGRRPIPAPDREIDA